MGGTAAGLLLGEKMESKHSLGEPELRRKPCPTPMPRPLLPYKIPMVFVG